MSIIPWFWLLGNQGNQRVDEDAGLSEIDKYKRKIRKNSKKLFILFRFCDIINRYCYEAFAICGPILLQGTENGSFRTISDENICINVS